MTPQLRAAFDNEMALARRHYRAGDFATCFRHLERAHILGQRYYLPHLSSPYWMFKAGIRSCDLRKVAGQLLRMAASVGSLVSVLPIGNTGRAKVSAFKPRPIPADLRSYLME